MNIFHTVILLGVSLPLMTGMPAILEGEDDYQDEVVFVGGPGAEAEYIRPRRDSPPSYSQPSYSPPAPAYAPAAPAYHGPSGRVGPVYTFVKTDREGNIKGVVRDG